MLNVRELTIKDYQHDLILVDDLSFTLNQNDKIAIIGSEGSGKSTLLSVLKGDIASYVSISGEIRRPKVVSFLDQNMLHKWRGFTIEELLQTDLPRVVCEYNDVIIKLFDQFDMNYFDIKDRLIDTFSGGEKVKIGLVKSLIVKPDLLLLDEPSNDLDFETLQFIEYFLKEISIPVLFISHDQRLLENVCNGIIHLQHVHKKTIAKTKFLRVDYLEYKKLYIKHFESDKMIARKQRADYDKKILKFRQIYDKVSHQQNITKNDYIGQLLKKKIRNLRSQEKRFLKEKEQFIEIPEKEEPMFIFFEDLGKQKTYKTHIDLDIKNFKLPNNEIIAEIKLVVRTGEKFVITGRNGVGKTSLLKYIYKELKASNKKVGYIPQNYDDILENNISAINYLMKNQNKYDISKIRQILGTLGLKKAEMIKQINELSEGTKLKVILLKLVSNDYDILLLDEPTRNISPMNQDEIYDLFLNYQGALIAVSHDREFIDSVFDEIHELTNMGLKEINIH